MNRLSFFSSFFLTWSVGSVFSDICLELGRCGTMLASDIAFFLGFGLDASLFGFSFPRLENHATHYFFLNSHRFIELRSGGKCPLNLTGKNLWHALHSIL